MPVFQCKVIERSGLIQSELVLANSRTQVYELLNKRSLVPRSVICVSGVQLPLSLRLRQFFTSTRCSSAKLTHFTRQLATLAQAGVSLPRIFAVLQQQYRQQPALNTVICHCLDQLEQGAPLSAALADFPTIFDKTYLALVTAGESAGKLATAFAQLAELLEQQLAVRQQVLSALLYPTMVLSVAALLVGLIVLYVIPQFENLYQTSVPDAELPQLTQALIQGVHAVHTHPVVVIMICLGGCIFGAWCSRKTWWHRWLFFVPIISEVTVSLATAQFCRTLALLLQGGISLLPAFTQATAVVGNQAYAQALVRVQQSIQQGASLTTAFLSEKRLPAGLVAMVEVGEETGDLVAVLQLAASDAEQTARLSLRHMLTLLEPSLIVALALGVGLLVIALFLPLVNTFYYL